MKYKMHKNTFGHSQLVARREWFFHPWFNPSS